MIDTIGVSCGWPELKIGKGKEMQKMMKGSLKKKKKMVRKQAASKYKYSIRFDTL